MRHEVGQRLVGHVVQRELAEAAGDLRGRFEPAGIAARERRLGAFDFGVGRRTRADEVPAFPEGPLGRTPPSRRSARWPAPRTDPGPRRKSKPLRAPYVKPLSSRRFRLMRLTNCPPRIMFRTSSAWKCGDCRVAPNRPDADLRLRAPADGPVARAQSGAGAAAGVGKSTWSRRPRAAHSPKTSAAIAAIAAWSMPSDGDQRRPRRLPRRR